MEHSGGSPSRRLVSNRRRGSRLWRFGLGLLVLFALAAGTGIGYFYFGSSTVRQMVHDWRRGLWRPEKAFPGRSDVTLLLLGRDVDLDNRARVVNTYGRTDTILLMHLDFAARTANVLSIPRDTLVRIPGYPGEHKINSAHAFGGPKLTARTVESFLGVRSEEYLVVDYRSFEKAIDMLGGLEVFVPKRMDYDDNWGGLHIHLRPGTQVLNGEQALGFVRYRKSNEGQSDTDQDRIERQHQLLMAAKRKIVSPSTFFRLPAVIETVRGGVSSSMSDAQMMAIANFVRGLPPGAIRAATIPGVTGRTCVTADLDAARELANQMF
jgi:LCP family protein required for cell wall assembly